MARSPFWPLSVDLIHLKDRDIPARRTVLLGDGDVPWAKELTRLLTEAAKARNPVREIHASIETHCPQDGRNATARSVAALRRIAVADRRRGRLGLFLGRRDDEAGAREVDGDVADPLVADG